MSVNVGNCGICGTQKIEFTIHHVVEYLDDKGRTPKVPNMRWGALMNRAPTNNKVAEMNINLLL